MARLMCPACGSRNIVRITYGLPDHELASDTSTVLGGCVIVETSPTHACRGCHHRWLDPQVRLRRNPVAAAYKRLRPPAYLRPIWPSWMESSDSWVPDATAFLAFARRHSSYSALWQHSRRVDWMLWLYSRCAALGVVDETGDAPKLEAVTLASMVHLLNAIPEVPHRDVLTQLLRATVDARAGHIGRGEWNTVLLMYVRKRPKNNRTAAEQILFEACREIVEHGWNFSTLAAASGWFDSSTLRTALPNPLRGTASDEATA